MDLKLIIFSLTNGTFISIINQNLAKKNILITTLKQTKLAPKDKEWTELIGDQSDATDVTYYETCLLYVLGTQTSSKPNPNIPP